MNLSLLTLEKVLRFLFFCVKNNEIDKVKIDPIVKKFPIVLIAIVVGRCPED